MQAYPVEGIRRITWLASYPKSGNTWTRLLLANFLADRDKPVDINRSCSVLAGTISSNRVLFDELTGVPSSDLTDDEIDMLRPDVYRAAAAEAQTIDRRLFCKVHDAYHDTQAGEPLFPQDVTVGAIYLLRNPLDVAVSYAFHSGHEKFSRIVKRINNPEAAMAGLSKNQLRQLTFDWSRHIETWTTSAPFPVLIVRYEDLLADTYRWFSKMVDFLNLWDSENIPNQDSLRCDRLRKAVAFSDFAQLQRNEEESEGGFHERAPQAKRFFRSGTVGDWRRYLTETQIQEILCKHAQVMSAFQYDTTPSLEGLASAPPNST